jgi:hypothetical protein
LALSGVEPECVKLTCDVVCVFLFDVLFFVLIFLPLLFIRVPVFSFSKHPNIFITQDSEKEYFTRFSLQKSIYTYTTSVCAHADARLTTNTDHKLKTH